MKFALLITGAPVSTHAPHSALRFARAAIAQGHEIVRVFFYHDAVYCASTFPVSAQDEPAISAQWQDFLQERITQGEPIDAVVCVTAANKRGITAANLAPTMQISGLGQLIDSCVSADRVLTFGG